MPWKVVERKIGRAGSKKRRDKKQRDWDKKYGMDNWMVGYVIEGEFVEQQKALDTVYYESYRLHFSNTPKDLKELIALAKKLRNPHARLGLIYKCQQLKSI